MLMPILKIESHFPKRILNGIEGKVMKYCDVNRGMTLATNIPKSILGTFGTCQITDHHSL